MTEDIKRFPPLPERWAYRTDLAELLQELRVNLCMDDWPQHVLISILCGFSDELGERWLTAQELLEHHHSVNRLDAGLSSPWMDVERMGKRMPLDANFIDSFLELFKGIEYYDRVLMRTCEKTPRWGVVWVEERKSAQPRGSLRLRLNELPSEDGVGDPLPWELIKPTEMKKDQP